MFSALFVVGLLVAFLESCEAQLPTFKPPWGSSSDEGTPKKHNNGLMVAFIIIYILFAAINVVLLIKRKSTFAPILAIHSNRSNKASDFTAFGAKAESINQTVRSLNEEVLWADVTLRVPSTGTLFLIIGPAIFGMLIVIVATRVMPAHLAAFVTPVLLVLLIPQIYHMVISYKQIIGGQHYTIINVLTPRGAHIMQDGGCCGTASHFYPYDQMINVHTETSGNIGNVYFAEKWALEKVEHTHAHRGHIHKSESKEWKKHGIGFTYVVQPMEVQAIILAHTNGGRPASEYPGQYENDGSEEFTDHPHHHPLTHPPKQGFSIGIPTGGINLNFNSH